MPLLEVWSIEIVRILLPSTPIVPIQGSIFRGALVFDYVRFATGCINASVYSDSAYILLFFGGVTGNMEHIAGCL